MRPCWRHLRDFVRQTAVRSWSVAILLTMSASTARAVGPTGLVFTTPDSLVAGRTLTLSAVAPATLTIPNDDTLATTTLQHAALLIHIDSAVHGSFLHFAILGGSGAIGAFRYAGITHDSATFSFSGAGTGSIGIGSGTVFAEVPATVAVQGAGSSVALHASGQRQDVHTIVLRMDGDAIGVFPTLSVPMLGIGGVLALMLALAVVVGARRRQA